MAFNRQIEIAFGPEGGEGTKIKDLHMSFDITRNRTNTSNKAEVKIYNLTRESARRLTEKDTKIIIRAGYADEGGLVNYFFGDVIKVTFAQSGSETETKVIAYDGAAGRYRKANLSYQANTPASIPMSDLLDIIGYPVSGQRPALTDRLANGWAYSGPAVAGLTQLLDPYGWKWTIQNESILFYKDGQPPAPSMLKLSYGSGLLGIRRKDENALLDVAIPPKKGTLYVIESLLFPQLLPGSPVAVETQKVKGSFLIVGGKQKGSNFNDDHISEIEAIAT